MGGLLFDEGSTLALARLSLKNAREALVNADVDPDATRTDVNVAPFATPPAWTWTSISVIDVVIAVDLVNVDSSRPVGPWDIIERVRPRDPFGVYLSCGCSAIHRLSLKSTQPNHFWPLASGLNLLGKGGCLSAL